MHDRKPAFLRQEIWPEKVEVPLDDDGLASVNVESFLVARMAWETRAQDLNIVVDIDGKVPILILAVNALLLTIISVLCCDLDLICRPSSCTHWILDQQVFPTHHDDCTSQRR